MTAMTSPDILTDAAQLTAKIKKHVRGNWLHEFDLRDDRSILSAESLNYRRRHLEDLFRSLLVDRSVLVLDEASGVYPALIRRAGARSVTATNADARTCELIKEVSRFLEVDVAVTKRQLLGFYDGEPYVDMEFKRAHDFILALAQIWPLFGASGGSFDAVVEACSFFAKAGLVFDFTDASWASPPPPPSYSLDAFMAALRLKFEFVTCYGGWLVVAVGRLADPPLDFPEDSDEEQLAPASIVTPSHYALQFSGPGSYEEFVLWFRSVVCRTLPQDSTVLVVSRGEPMMVDLEDRTAWHFPRGEDGQYAGYYPADSADAIAQMEALRTEGAQFIVFPKPSTWWLDHYSDFGAHLHEDYEVFYQDNFCVIYSLLPEPVP